MATALLYAADRQKVGSVGIIPTILIKKARDETVINLQLALILTYKKTFP